MPKKGSTKTASKSERSKGADGAKKDSNVSQEKLASKVELPVINEQELSDITVNIEAYLNILPQFSSTFLFARCEFLGETVDETHKILMTDEPKIDANHVFKIKVRAMDVLASYPVIIKIFQLPYTDSKIIVSDPTKTENEKLVLEESVSSVESAVSLYEALTGDTVEKVEFVSKPSDMKSKTKIKQKKKSHKKGSKISARSESVSSKKSSKMSAETKKSKRSSKREQSRQSLKQANAKQENEAEVGACVIDLLPLIFGNTTLSEFIALIPPEPACDENMQRYTQKPGIQVFVEMEKPLENICKPQILHLTLESIYNVPSMMNEEMGFSACFNSISQTVLFQTETLTTKATKADRPKMWSTLPKSYFNVTRYKSDSSVNNIKNCADGVDLQEIIAKETPRIEFNSIKRIVLLKEEFLSFYDHLRQYGRLILEIHAFKKSSGLSSTSEKTKNKKTSSGQIKDGTKPAPYLHLMGVVDLSSLLYPGVTKTRVAVPLTTYHEQEALTCGGLTNSYFFPSPPKIVTSDLPSKLKVLKKSRSKSKASKTSTSSKSKSSKKSKKSEKSQSTKKANKAHEEKSLDLKNELPPEPLPELPLEPSLKVFNENRQRTFVVIEVELTHALVEKKSIEDLHTNLTEIVSTKLHTPKVLLNNGLAVDFYRTILRKVVSELNKKYITFVEKKNLCRCENRSDFLEYLKRTGTYQNFVFSLMHVAALITHSSPKFCSLVNNEQNLQGYNNVVEQIFVTLTTEVHHVLHTMSPRTQNVPSLAKIGLETLLFYAMEATEMRNLSLAERYYLERLYRDSSNPDVWFDYAVYKMECDQTDHAFMCLHEALSKKLYHRNSLMLTGILLTDKKCTTEAELCLSSLMVQEPRWVEGWGVFYLFYDEMKNMEGMDFAKEMALKYLDDPKSANDDFGTREDLVWTSKICPNSLFIKVAVLLIKMRMYTWAENALSHELKESGIVHYLLAVICYYTRQYPHALEHLERARFLHGSDYAVVSLTGHCCSALNHKVAAVEQYRQVLESFERPEDIHLVYVNCAWVTDDLQEARKMLLWACKHNPTPHTWMSCGIIYFKLNDLVSAEECFCESTNLDNSLGECWAYLALVNLNMKRVNEAEICYCLALKNKLSNEYLKEELKNEFGKLTLK